MANQIYFSDFFRIDPDIIDSYGALDISLLNDLPLFIDPFLIFCSDDSECQKMHGEIIRYLVYLRDKAVNSRQVNTSELRYLYCFPEVRQTYLGFCQNGNYGSGLGMDFAKALHAGLKTAFSDFGNETITKGKHLEKVCLLKEGVGKDNISDFITNLVKPYLCTYTEQFAKDYLQPEQCAIFNVDKCEFDYTNEIWRARKFYLPKIIDQNGHLDFVLLTPTMLLVRDDAWINRKDMIRNFTQFAAAIPDEVLRDRVNAYFNSQLNEKSNKGDREYAAESTIHQFPILTDYYIRYQEDRERDALARNLADVTGVQQVFIEQLLQLIEQLKPLGFYDSNVPSNSYEEAMERLKYLKHVVEDCDGYRYFYDGDKPIHRESDLHIMYRLACCNTVSDANAEVNNGRGPVDFKLSRGRRDQTLVEFKLARTLKRNLEKQVDVYKSANDHPNIIKAIMYFTDEEQKKVFKILNDLELMGKDGIVLIDARKDNKIQASKS